MNTTEFGNMVRDERDVWPQNEPIGSFDISLNKIENYPTATGHIIFVCPNEKRCVVIFGNEPKARESEDQLFIWGFNNNLEKPTFTPSINCISEKNGKPTGGCGWHGFITNGIIK